MRRRPILILPLLFLTISLLSGCGGGGGEPATTATVLVQLTRETATTTAYPVENMTVYIQKEGGPEFHGLTNASGIASIAVGEVGEYQLTRVVGIDASSLAEGSEGREFVKGAPLADPYPNITYTYTDGPSVNVTALGSDYPVNAPVPAIIRVTVLKAGSVTVELSGTIAAGTSSFPGRVMLSNINCSDIYASITLWSNDANGNRLVIRPNEYGGNPQINSASIYGGAPSGISLGDMSSYTQDGPIYFEAPGTDGGDWALGCNLGEAGLKTRAGLGGADPARNFPGFLNTAVISISNAAGQSGQTYSLNYRIFKFDALL